MVSLAEILETIMLLLFSLGWYWSIARMLRVRSARGKSATFVALVTLGYVLGAAAKVAVALEAGTALSPVFYVYVWNVLVTGTDLALVLVYQRREARAAP